MIWSLNPKPSEGKVRVLIIIIQRISLKSLPGYPIHHETAYGRINYLPSNIMPFHSANYGKVHFCDADWHKFGIFLL